tara:strand:+ start:666 stop:917 length:252 start_codon:yes stop_codon:yes gene_type:complete
LKISPCTNKKEELKVNNIKAEIILFFLLKIKEMIPKIKYDTISAEIDHEGSFIPIPSPKRGVEFNSKRESIVLKKIILFVIGS